MSLPPELDFEQDREASPARMNRAMLYLFLRLGAATALQPEFRTAIDQLNEVGLARLNEVLTPIFLQAQETSADLLALKNEWLTGDPLEQLLADLADQVAGAISGTNAAAAIATAAAAAANASLAGLLQLARAERAFISGGF